MGDKNTLGMLSTLRAHTEAIEPEITYLGAPGKAVSLNRNDDEEQTLLLQNMLHEDRDHDQSEDSKTANRCVVMMVSCMMPVLSMCLLDVLTAGVYYGTTYMSYILSLDGSATWHLVVQFFILVLNLTLSVLVMLLLAAFVKRCCCPEFKGLSHCLYPVST